MSELSKKFEQIVVSTYKKLYSEGSIPPVRTEQGIEVGNVLITADGAYKSLWVGGTCIYKDISLNCVTIKVANLLALNKNSSLQKKLFDLDKEYNRHFVDKTIFLRHYQLAEAKEDEIRCDIMWARYTVARDLCKKAKEKAESLASF